MTPLKLVNRIFRLNAIIRGDNDPITSFSDVQHNASTQLAIIAVQDEIGDWYLTGSSETRWRLRRCRPWPARAHTHWRRILFDSTERPISI